MILRFGFLGGPCGSSGEVSVRYCSAGLRERTLANLLIRTYRLDLLYRHSRSRHRDSYSESSVSLRRMRRRVDPSS